MSVTTSSSFKYVLIPAENSSRIITKEGDKSGGLSEDHLQKDAKEYFWNQSGRRASGEINSLDGASSSERHAFADRIRSETTGTFAEHVSQMDDDAVINMIKTTQGTASTEIIAVTVPTPTNKFQSVSMYSSPNAENLPVNARATELLKSCGHHNKEGVRGDVFVGRCIDNEMDDIWTRIDFTEKDANPDSEWCREASKKGGGGGTGGRAASSSNMMSGGAGLSRGDGGGEKKEGEYVWSQTNDEVELKFVVAIDTLSKEVKVNFGRNNLKVTVRGKTLAEGELGGSVIVDECTYTIQNIVGGKEICLSLAKRNEDVSWSNALKPGAIS
mmetsp:Transcript_61344/g.72861  ORF Transcript_61344/g.72861 Transcript_61344/m.72861 type:complete len:329 (-) Transcript_61344:115-1101(-)|eukprot:CAMPEP_0172497524 /NCGR_PEP_ID=MMETSP1066-20121228/101154_1 /TAXON_ID=671091 /ORGANISM="Coscinodiscus wailesii, Strain CCMP2513" /LENGTH=328 /DNA_ID=CAMNT_0013270353 /DNA_START=97 /DNA_END=1083 /DNA_ORIENTATION=+